MGVVAIIEGCIWEVFYFWEDTRLVSKQLAFGGVRVDQPGIVWELL